MSEDCVVAKVGRTEINRSPGGEPVPAHCATYTE